MHTEKGGRDMHKGEHKCECKDELKGIACVYIIDVDKWIWT